jgi:hypothetical protein
MKTRWSAAPISKSVWTITRGGRKVGSIIKTENGYIGKIGDTSATAPSAKQAFDQVVSQASGFANVAQLKQHNTQVAQHNAQLRSQARAAADQSINRGNSDPLLDLLLELLPTTKR